MTFTKHIFVLNPSVGNTDALLAFLYKELSNSDFDWATFVSSEEEATIRYVRDWCEQHSEPVRFYACGGDGTLHVIINCIHPYPHASCSTLPIGKSNDFVKYYGGAARFQNPDALCQAEESLVDLIEVGANYAVNACHFGLDSYVAATKNRLAKKSRLFKKCPYFVSLFYALFFGMRHTATIKVDGETVHKGDFLLCTLANGSHVGGSYFCAPRSKNNDGWLDFCLIKHVSRLRFLTMMGIYKNGKHLESKAFQKYMIYRRCKKIEVIANPGFIVSLDGEIRRLPNFTAEIAPSAVRFAVPKRQHD